VSHFEALVKADPRDQDALFGLGLAYQKAGRLDRAVEACKPTFLRPERYGILRELGLPFISPGKWNKPSRSWNR